MGTTVGIAQILEGVHLLPNEIGQQSGNEALNQHGEGTLVQVPPMHDKLADMTKAGVVHPSKSPYSSLVVLVCKKDGGLQFCVDSEA